MGIPRTERRFGTISLERGGVEIVVESKFCKSILALIDAMERDATLRASHFRF